MKLTDKQREVLIEERGEPELSIEFDVFKGNRISMWTHFNHSADYSKVKEQLHAIKDHLDEFLKDEKMCPFYKQSVKL